jgi:hypothetical protein
MNLRLTISVEIGILMLAGGRIMLPDVRSVEEAPTLNTFKFSGSHR